MPLPNTPNYFTLQFPSYQPAMREILSITQSNPVVVTTTFDGTNPGNNQYITGLVVRLYIPEGFGMPEINKKVRAITVLSDSTFSMDIDSTNFTPFVVPAYNPGHFGTPAQVAVIGEVNSLLLGAVQNVLPIGTLPVE